MSALTVAVNAVVSSRPSRLYRAEAAQAERDGVHAWPEIDDLVLTLTVRDHAPYFLNQAGLAASTVTPGSTAPDVSRTTPAMLPLSSDWGHADGWREAQHDTHARKTYERYLSMRTSR